VFLLLRWLCSDGDTLEIGFLFYSTFKGGSLTRNTDHIIIGGR